MKLILEIGCNHNGSFKLAKEMISKAAELGVWAVKFQKRDLDSIPEHVLKTKPNGYKEKREGLEFSIKQIAELKELAKKKDLKFICTAFDLQSAIELKSINCEYIKLPSQLYLDHELFRFLSNHKQSVFVSTGMHDSDEIMKSKWIQEAFCVMHCISIYPFDYKDAQLGGIHSLTKACVGAVGYSSHDKNGEAIPYAVLAGAEFIERHFTLDKTMEGADHGTVSSDPQDIKKIIKEVEKIQPLIKHKVLSEAETKTRKIYRGF